jgi:uncharacterized membrane protein YeaQ/YmgE (transglycosylase-associated protein family)
MFSIIGWIIVGLIAGALAKWIMPGKDPGGIIVTLGLGLVGAFVAGLITNLILGENLATGFNITTIIIATLGAILLLFLYRVIMRNRASV